MIALVGICSAVYYGYVNYIQKPIIQCGDGFRINPATNECVEVVVDSDQDKQEIDFAKLIINVPSSSARVSLEKNDKGIYVGTYTDPDTPSSRGMVLVDPKDIVVLDDALALMPLVLNSGGTGQFMYITLVDIVLSEHLASVFVDDRITLKSIELKNNMALVNYMTRVGGLSYAESPVIPAQLVLSLESKSLTELMRIENSTYDQIELKSPRGSSTIVGDFVVKGAVPGFWYFEAIAGYRILDKNLNVIAMGPVQALSDWMTERRVPFELKLNTGSFGYKGDAVIIIESENVQGGEEGELLVKRIKIPVTIK